MTLPLERIDEFRWRIPVSAKDGMLVPGVVYADDCLMEDIRHDKALEQVANAAMLPGIVKASLAMPDIHYGYGLPIGGVVATGGPDGVVTPGGVGFDINCGVRLMRTSLTVEEVRPRLRDLIVSLYQSVPLGVGSRGNVRLKGKEARDPLTKGAAWAVSRGFGVPRDLEYAEANGCLDGADPDLVSDRAFERGSDQQGTLGSGNHFLEVQVVDEVFDTTAADAFGLVPGAVAVMIHSGSRGFGHQVCTDYLKVMERASSRYGIVLPDRQLACAPLGSEEGRRYVAAMRAAANYAWANRQCLMHSAREVLEKVFRKGPAKIGADLIYDVAHNIVKSERHVVDGKEAMLAVHRKGATRAFPPGHPELPVRYRPVGQPVIIPGDMGSESWVLAGTAKAMEETFGSSCHGAGRVLSRTAAIKAARGRSIAGELEGKGIIVMAAGRETLAEEMPEAYKDVSRVVDVVAGAGLARKVARLRPLGVIKG